MASLIRSLAFPFWRPRRSLQRLIALSMLLAAVGALSNYQLLISRFEASFDGVSTSSTMASSGPAAAPPSGGTSCGGSAPSDETVACGTPEEVLVSVEPATDPATGTVPRSWTAVAEVLGTGGQPVSSVLGDFAVTPLTGGSGGEDIPVSTDGNGTALGTFSATGPTEVTFSSTALSAVVDLDPIDWALEPDDVPVSVGVSGRSQSWSQYSSWLQSAPTSEHACYSNAALSITVTSECSSGTEPPGWGTETPTTSPTSVACSAFDLASAAVTIGSCAATATLAGCAVLESGIGTAACIFGLTQVGWALPTCVGGILGAIGDLLSGTQSGGDTAADLQQTITATSNVELVQNGAQFVAQVGCGTIDRSYSGLPAEISTGAAEAGPVDLTLRITDSLGDLVPGAVVYVSFTDGAGGSASIGDVALSSTPTAVSTADGTVTIIYRAPSALAPGGTDELTVSATDGGAVVASSSYSPMPCPNGYPAADIGCGAIPFSTPS